MVSKLAATTNPAALAFWLSYPAFLKNDSHTQKQVESGQSFNRADYWRALQGQTHPGAAGWCASNPGSRARDRL